MAIIVPIKVSEGSYLNPAPKTPAKNTPAKPGKCCTLAIQVTKAGSNRSSTSGAPPGLHPPETQALHAASPHHTQRVIAITAPTQKIAIALEEDG